MSWRVSWITTGTFTWDWMAPLELSRDRYCTTQWSIKQHVGSCSDPNLGTLDIESIQLQYPSFLSVIVGSTLNTFVLYVKLHTVVVFVVVVVWHVSAVDCSYVLFVWTKLFDVKSTRDTSLVCPFVVILVNRYPHCYYFPKLHALTFICLCQSGRRFG